MILFCSHLISVLLLFAVSSAINTSVFLQAISSSLAAIPFTGFPMGITSGLVGAKLAMGAKLLYYLGYFGRNRLPNASSTRQGGLGPSAGVLPLPYTYHLAASEGMPPDVFHPQIAAYSAPRDPSLILQALQEFNVNPLALFQALESVGIDPAYFLHIVSQETGPDNAKEVIFTETPSSPDNRKASTKPKGNSDDIENFFSFLRDMDDNKCISRLVCDIGANPAFLGEFTQNIDTIISSLEVPPGSLANEYIKILDYGRSEGDCAQRFVECSDDAYEMVKSVAPSVGMPPMNSEQDT